MNQYDNSFFNEIVASTKQKEPEVSIPSMKHYHDPNNTGRTMPAPISIEDRLKGLEKHDLSRREILAQADMKPPSYFKEGLGKIFE